MFVDLYFEREAFSSFLLRHIYQMLFSYRKIAYDFKEFLFFFSLKPLTFVALSIQLFEAMWTSTKKIAKLKS